MIYAECSNCWPLQMAFMTWSNVVSHYDKRETCTISLSSWPTSVTGICDMFHFKLGATPGLLFLPRVVAVYLCLLCLFSFEVALLLHIKRCTTCYAAMLPCHYSKCCIWMSVLWPLIISEIKHLRFEKGKASYRFPTYLAVMLGNCNHTLRTAKERKCTGCLWALPNFHKFGLLCQLPFAACEWWHLTHKLEWLRSCSGCCTTCWYFITLCSGRVGSSVNLHLKWFRPWPFFQCSHVCQ